MPKAPYSGSLNAICKRGKLSVHRSPRGNWKADAIAGDVQQTFQFADVSGFKTSANWKVCWTNTAAVLTHHYFCNTTQIRSDSSTSFTLLKH